MRAAHLCTCRKKGAVIDQLIWCEGGSFIFPAAERPRLYGSQSLNHLTSNYNYLQHPTVSSISTPTGAAMQLFRHHCWVFGFLFHFNRGEIGNIFFYSPLAPLESLLSFGLFMKNYFMLTYICRLFSPSVTRSRFSSISKSLKANSLCLQVSLLDWVEIEIPVCSGKGMARGNQWFFIVSRVIAKRKGKGRLKEKW